MKHRNNDSTGTRKLATILEPGLQTTVQDTGRPGFRHLGVPHSGAADLLSFTFANTAAGARPGAGVLECAIAGPTLKFECDSIIAIAGADMTPLLNGAPIPCYAPVQVRKDDVLKLGGTIVGARTYIAFQEGVSGDPFLGSISTYLPAGISGHQGRALRKEDVLFTAGLEPETPTKTPIDLRMALGHDFILRATVGPEAEAFTVNAMDGFFTTPFIAGGRGNRMGLQLNGSTNALTHSLKITSSAVFPGTVQCPPDGAPFLLLADAQTLGGYPRIAQVITADLPLTGQIKQGDRVWLHRVDTQTARDITLQRQDLIRIISPEFSFY